MYATGIGNAVEPNQGAVHTFIQEICGGSLTLQALLYHTFAAMAGNTRSEMTVAYRHLMGIGTPRSCEEAVQYYKRVADKCNPPHPPPPNLTLDFTWTNTSKQSPTTALAHQEAATSPTTQSTSPTTKAASMAPAPPTPPPAKTPTNAPP
jgi:hypothetical protein